jgi:adenylate cyclase
MQGLWQFYYVRGMLPTSRALGEQLLEIARDADDSTFLLLAHRSVASSSFLQGDFETCRVHTRAGLDIYSVRDHGSLALRTGHDPGVAHGVYQAWTLWMLGYPDQALACVKDSIALARRLAHPLTMAYALCFAALIHNHRGEHEEARALSDESLGITIENKFALWTAWGKLQRGWALAALREYDRGIRLMREGLDDWKNTGARVGFTFFPVTLAEMCLHAGRLADAVSLLDEAVPMIERNDEHFYEAELWRLRGEAALLRADGRASADEHFRRGLELSLAQKAKAWELRLVLSRARMLASEGEAARARAMLGEAVGWFEEGRETGDLRAARAQLAEWDTA